MRVGRREEVHTVNLINIVDRPYFRRRGESETSLRKGRDLTLNFCEKAKKSVESNEE